MFSVRSSGEVIGDCLRLATVMSLVAGSVLLALHPAEWLVRTWYEPGYESDGWVFAALCAGLLIWSCRSSRTYSVRPRFTKGVVLILVAALVRALSQSLGVNVLGALTLVIDVYAIALLLGVSERRRSLSPGWLAVLFAMALPLERVVQRTLGYPLQWLSAELSCAVLNVGWPEVECHGVRIVLAGKDVLVDLPCSGARGLLMLLAAFCLLATLIRPTWKQALMGLAITLFAALAGNTVRICLLALGIAFPQWFGGIDVMATPWHDAIGLLTLGLSALPLLAWFQRAGTKDGVAQRFCVGQVTADKRTGSPGDGWRLTGAVAFCLVAVLVLCIPTRPVDVSRPLANTVLPEYLAGYARQDLALSSAESAYFVRYGGAASRASYGPFGLLKVETSAPLRHLHSPEECLSGAGHDVQYLGLHHDGFPTAVYRSVAPDGAVWRIEVSYLSADGQSASNVAEVVWLWLRSPGQTWTMVQRISPWQMREADRVPFQRAVTAALEFHPASV